MFEFMKLQIIRHIKVIFARSDHVDIQKGKVNPSNNNNNNKTFVSRLFSRNVTLGQFSINDQNMITCFQP